MGPTSSHGEGAQEGTNRVEMVFSVHPQRHPALCATERGNLEHQFGERNCPSDKNYSGLDYSD